MKKGSRRLPFTADHVRPRRQEQEPTTGRKAEPAGVIEKSWPKASNVGPLFESSSCCLGLAWSSVKGGLRPPFFNNPCWLCFVYCNGFLLLSSWLGIVYAKMAFGDLFSKTPAGYALCTVMGSCSCHLGLARSSVKGGLRPPLFNNPCWLCGVYCVWALLLSSLSCMAVG